MANPKVTYQAMVGFDFEGLKPPVRVEAGEKIPDKVPASEIAELMAQGLIRILPEESEGEV